VTEGREKTLPCPFCGTLSVVSVDRAGDFVCPACGSKAALSESGETVLVEEGTVEDSLIGKRIGAYKIERILGSGGMGRVYYAYQESVDRAVALKLLSPSLSENKNLKERFIMEAKAAGRLLHPNIVTVFDAGEVEGKAYIAMEFVDGESLAQRIFEQGRLEVSEVLNIGRQIASALSYAHTCRVIHRDIKPANILIRKDGVAKLADMGLAKRIDLPGVTMPGAIMGTPFYMAPEQAVDSASVDHRADIYSLGATMYHALVGKVPFEGASTIEVLAKQKIEALKFPKDVGIPQGVRALIMKMMAKEPADRFQSWEEVIAAINALSEKRQLTKSKRVLTYGVIVVAVLIILIAFLVVARTGEIERRLKDAERFWNENPEAPDKTFEMFFKILPLAADTRYFDRVISGAETAFRALSNAVLEKAKSLKFDEADALLQGELDGQGIPKAEELLKEREKLRAEIVRYRILSARVNDLFEFIKQKRVQDLVSAVDPELRRTEAAQRFLQILGFGISLTEFKILKIESMEIEETKATVKVYTEVQRQTKEGPVIDKKTDDWDFIEKEGVWYLSLQKRPPKPPHIPKPPK